MVSRFVEVQQKLALVRTFLSRHHLSVLVFRNTSWFSWITAGGSNRVLMGAEQGIAEVYITATEAFVMTDNIEAQRLEQEELPENCLEVMVFPWTQIGHRAVFLQSLAQPRFVASDVPDGSEQSLPKGLLEARLVLCEGETERLPEVGYLAAQAMTEAMLEAKPDWSEQRLASEGADALLRRGLVPEVILVAGQERLPVYRHPMPTSLNLKRRAMMVFCAQKYGLIVNLTRFIEFGSLSSRWRRQHQTVSQIESDILNACQPGISLGQMYHAAEAAYSRHGFAKEIGQHHQGGIGGYRPRELLATPHASQKLEPAMLMAWNPSLPGVKIEDSFLLQEDGSLKNLTFDPNWSSSEVNGRQRPSVLEANHV
jgi:Xaa-Pro aminopeptidase